MADMLIPAISLLALMIGVFYIPRHQGPAALLVFGLWSGWYLPWKIILCVALLLALAVGLVGYSINRQRVKDARFFISTLKARTGHQIGQSDPAKKKIDQ